MAVIPHVRLSLSSKAENVLLVRQALSGLAETIALDPVELNDISTAASEACNNVVLHAYDVNGGPLEVEIYVESRALVLVVRDYGEGIERSEIEHEEMAGGIGLPVIRALAREVEFDDMAGAGTEVTMRFDTAHTHPLELTEDDRSAEPNSVSSSATGSGDLLRFAVGPPSLARAVIPRILSALAARAYFSTDRISDTQLLADAILGQALDSIDASRLSVEVELGRRDLRLRLGPLRAGAAAAVLEAAVVDELGSILDRLSDGHEIQRQGSSETLGLRLADRR